MSACLALQMSELTLKITSVTVKVSYPRFSYLPKRIGTIMFRAQVWSVKKCNGKLKNDLCPSEECTEAVLVHAAEGWGSWWENDTIPQTSKTSFEIHHHHHHQVHGMSSKPPCSPEFNFNLPLLKNGGLITRGLCTRRGGLMSVTSCGATETR